LSLFGCYYNASLIYSYLSIEAKQDSMTEMLFFVCVENYLCSFTVGKRRKRRDQIFVYFNSKNFFEIFIPNEDTNLFDFIVKLTQVVAIHFFAFSLIKITF